MVRTVLVALVFGMSALSSTAQMPPVEPGVSLELAKLRAERYSDVRYKLNLTLEKMSPVLRGTIEIRVKVSGGTGASSSSASSSEKAPCPNLNLTAPQTPIILDWRRIRGHEEKSSVTNIEVNGRPANVSPSFTNICRYEEYNEHLVFRDGVVAGENVIKLDFTSPILTSGSAITRYVDKEDGSEYIYSLFVPSDASTAFPVFDQPDLKARFTLQITAPTDWTVIGNNASRKWESHDIAGGRIEKFSETAGFTFGQTQPISTYVFAFAAGPFKTFSQGFRNPGVVVVDSSEESAIDRENEYQARLNPKIYLRKSQAAKFEPHAAEVFRLNREAIKYFEEYFDYKFPFPKYDLVLIPEFPFGGMEHAGATFLRESSIIFPQEPTRNDHISRALLIFHEASHQWFGDTVTMRWFDDLWLKEGFATFTAYKAMERIMPEMNAWKVFYERVKQAAYQTDSTKGTTPIYQEIPNLSAAKSAYGNIVYNKAPAFLRQAEFYLGEDKFQTAVRAFLKKHEFGNAGWEDLVKEFQVAPGGNHQLAPEGYVPIWAQLWVTKPGLDIVRTFTDESTGRIKNAGRDTNDVPFIQFEPTHSKGDGRQLRPPVLLQTLIKYEDGSQEIRKSHIPQSVGTSKDVRVGKPKIQFVFPNYGDYGYGIFLLDEKSRDYVLKNIQNEKDPFLRSMMWGALWDSVREGELDPREYVELVVKVLSSSRRENHPVAEAATPLLRKEGSQEDESTTALLLNRVGTAMNYYVSDKAREELAPHVENLFSDKMRTAPTLGQRITFYRAFLNAASSENARSVLKAMIKSEPPASATGKSDEHENHPVGEAPTPLLRKEGSHKADGTPAVPAIPLKTKDKFDIVTRLLILGDPEAPALLAKLEKTETSDEAKRYAYAARAGIATAENKAKYWKDFTENKEISESSIEAAFGPWNSIRHSELTLPYLQKALQELPNHKRNRKIFFVNGWLGAFIGGQRSEEALGIINKFLADNPKLDNDLRLKILENADIIERAVNIRSK